MCSELHDAYLEHAHAHGDRHPLTSEQLGLRLRKLCPEAKLKRFRPWGDGREAHGIMRSKRSTSTVTHSFPPCSIDAHEWPQVEGEE